MIPCNTLLASDIIYNIYMTGNFNGNKTTSQVHKIYSDKIIFPVLHGHDCILMLEPVINLDTSAVSDSFYLPLI